MVQEASITPANVVPFFARLQAYVDSKRATTVDVSEYNARTELGKAVQGGEDVDDARATTSSALPMFGCNLFGSTSRSLDVRLGSEGTLFSLCTSYAGSASLSFTHSLEAAVHIDDAGLMDGNIDVAKTRPIARCGYNDYAVVKETLQTIVLGGGTMLAGLEENVKANTLASFEPELHNDDKGQVNDVSHVQ